MLAGLSRRVIVKDAETGRTQTYSVGSDVLAQQFAHRVSNLFTLIWLQLVWIRRCVDFSLTRTKNHLLVPRSLCFSMVADQGRSLALTCDSVAAGIKAGRPLGSVRNQPSPLSVSYRMRTTCWLLTCWARSGFGMKLNTLLALLKILGPKFTMLTKLLLFESYCMLVWTINLYSHKFTLYHSL